MTLHRTIVLAWLVLLLAGGCGSDKSSVTSPADDHLSGLSPQLLGEAPLACWDFDEGAGDTAADPCGEHPAALSGAGWGPGACGAALVCDGVDDWARIETGGWLTLPAGTLEAWVWIDPDGSGGRIVSNEAPGGADGLYLGWGTRRGDGQEIAGGVFGGLHATEGGTHDVEACVDEVAPGAWHFVALAWDDATDEVLLFVDGRTAAVSAAHRGAVDTGEPLTLGSGSGQGAGEGGWLKGAIDQVRIYSRALGADELQGHRSRLCGRQAVVLEIKPGSCPATLNPRILGYLPAAILGCGELDVADIDPASVTIAGVAPFQIHSEDVWVPSPERGSCDCWGEEPDGIPDLSLLFPAPEIVATLGPTVPGQYVTVTVTGRLFDGTEIEGSDCILIVGGKPEGEGDGGGEDEGDSDCGGESGGGDGEER